MAIKTPLYDMHIKYGGKVVDFAGYELPIQYNSIIAEHLAVREKVGMFDVSHMGEITFTGEGALATLNYLLANDFTNMYIGQVRYSMMLYGNGTIVDDVLVYKTAEDCYLVVVNACNKDKDYAWMQLNKLDKTTVTDMSAHFAQIALQGPEAEAVMASLIDINLLLPKNYSFTKDVNLKGINCIISRTGYTGEKGFEIYIAVKDAIPTWEILMATGKVTPCGLGARDTLRLEAAMPLYGHELSDEIMANEVGLDYSIKMTKDFIGRQALIDNPPKYKRIGLTLIDKGIAREGAKLYDSEIEVGYVTSGTFSPLTSRAIAMGRVLKDCNSNTLTVDIRGRKLKEEVVALPFNRK